MSEVAFGEVTRLRHIVRREYTNRIRASTAIASAGFLAYLLVDYTVAPGNILKLGIVRLLTCAALFLVAIMAQWNRYRHLIHLWSCLHFFVVCAGIISCSVLAGGAKTNYHEPLALIFIAWAGYLPTTFIISAFSFLVAIGAHEISLATSGTLGPIETSSQTLGLLLLSSGIGTGFLYANRKLRASERAARMQEFEAKRQLSTSNVSLQATNAKLAEANDKLTRIDVLKNESFANLSHDFRTPISFVKNAIQAALSYPTLDDGLRKLMTIAERYCKQSLGMINDLLDLTKLDNAAEPLQKSRFNLSRMLREISEHSVLRTEKRKIKIFFSPSAAPVIDVVANYKLIERACTNLVGNAIKYTDDGGAIETNVFVKAGRAHVQVSDTGIGIKPADHERVFGRFVQIKVEGRQSRGGVGLGLGYVKSVATSHGGETTISSIGVPGKGSTIGFWIPLPTREELSASSASFVPGQSDSHHSGGLAEWEEAESDRNAYRFQGIEDAAELRVLSRDAANPDALKILLVEDNADIARAMETFLAAEYNLRQARDGVEGLAMMDSFRPDLVISDVNMPNMDGEEMIRTMRNHAYGGTIPIVVLSARGLKTDEARLTEAGADAFLLKGCDIDDVKRVLRTQLKRQVSNRKMVEDERMLGLRAMAGGIAHEILNPLNLLSNYFSQIRVCFEVVLGNPETPSSVVEIIKKADRSLGGAERNSERARSCCEPLRRLSRGKENEAPMAKSSINVTVDTVVKAVDVKSDMIVNLQATQIIMAQPGRLEQVLVNLIINAQQACGDAYKAPIEVHSRDSGDGKFVEVTITDHGPGMSEELMSRIFVPYFTTKETGTGLGLHVCRDILAVHGGTLTVSSRVGEGSTFTMRVPAAAA